MTQLNKAISALKFWPTLGFALVSLAPFAASAQVPPLALAADTDRVPGKPRVFVLTDMGNEPDDQMSMVRLMLYTDEMDIEGLVATTSTWLREKVHPETIRGIIDAYGEVRPNLLMHAKGWPEAQQLAARVSSGQPSYGMASVGPGKSTSGSEALIAAVDRADLRPLWISVWGGANTIAQALRDVRERRTSAELAVFVAKMRVYSISDQDDAGPWIRREFPSLFYVVSPSNADGSGYASATWSGIAGDAFYRNGAGADFEKVTNDWLDRNVRSVGPLGRHYPKYEYIMEGDTPAYLWFVGNGLQSWRSPNWGGWGGRYNWSQPYGESHPIWSNGGEVGSRVDSRDSVVGSDGRTYVSDQATIWRWRNAFQNDFAARMQWTVKPFAAANHAPVAIVNRDTTGEPLAIEAQQGKPIVLDADGSRDPDKQRLRFRWFHYPEAGYRPYVAMADLAIEGAEQARATVTPTAACRPAWVDRQRPCRGGVAHIILEVTDTGEPALTSYRRVILDVRP
ncbi:hypothetical protein ASE90_16705 [Sphingomonas sp. Leaf67]|uniref:DUF1593 domain-containing protein n=1 Tax=Sphingomonas sp. Leaf67 TaxID=1736230 RepID=UPI0006F6A400|nr:DUF1593 domain-containing protein [Sphingomonas sp. Leaf67]KQN90741.1 hypothetical protein ASE90_16705 [Sphingomonas sp. Leaf67]